MVIDFTTMDGYQFEDFISSLFRRLGFEVEATNYSNDGGVDLVATFNKPIFSGKYIIQCKNWTGPVGQPEVRDLYGVVMDQRANKGILITPSDYTQQAYDFANGKNIELINGFVLRELMTADSENTKASATQGVNAAFRDDRYSYYQRMVMEEPNNVSNYLQIIEYLRNYVKDQNEEMCTLELFDDIIEWTNKMINRCFKTASKANDKEMAMLLVAEALIHSGRLAEATEILLKYNHFWINDYYSSDSITYGSDDKKLMGYSYYSIYAWNLYAGYKYVNYETGCRLIESKINHEGSFASLLMRRDLLSTYQVQQFGSMYIYSTPRWRPIGNGKTKHLNTTIFFPDGIKNPKFFFARFYKKTSQEYAEEIDNVLKLHGII